MKYTVIVATLLSKRPRDHGFLIGVTLVTLCTLLSYITWHSEYYGNALSVTQRSLSEGQYYKLFTSLFVHADLGHLISNAYMLLILSIFVFGTLARRRTEAALLLFVALCGGAAANALTVRHYEPDIHLIGISGFVYLLAGTWFSAYLMIDRRRPFSARLIRVIGVGLVVLFPTTFEKQTSYMAHFHGFWIGLVIGLSYFYLNRKRIRHFEVLREEEDEDPLDTASV